MRTKIQELIASADAADREWAAAHGSGPSVKDTERYEDARVSLADEAVWLLRALIERVDGGEDVEVALAPPEVIFMLWDGGPDEESFDDGEVLIDHGTPLAVCPQCSAIGGDFFEVEMAERWNQVSVGMQPDRCLAYGQHARGGYGIVGSKTNPLAGLPLLESSCAGEPDYSAGGYRCASCQKPVSMPDWVEVNAG